MADAFKLAGSFEATPLTNPLSFAQAITAAISESVTLSARQSTDMTLSSDSAAPVAFGGVTNANVVILKSTGGKVKARITSADGAVQAVPFDTYWILMSDTVPITAIDLTRVAGVETTVRVFIAQKA